MRWWSIVCGLLLCVTAQARLQLAAPFASQMLLQRNQPIHVWGKGTPQQWVKVVISKQTATTQVAADSGWSLYLPAMPASTQPLSMYVMSGTDSVVLTDVLIGDVWLCIGQSNMEWPVKKSLHAAEAMAAAQQPLLRFYNPSYAGKNLYNIAFTDSVIRRLNTQQFYQGTWQSCDSSSLPDMSAVAYFFGQYLLNNTGVPQGFVQLSIGGAPLETFIRREALAAHPQLAAKQQGNWLSNDALPVWVRERGMQNTANNTAIAADDLGPNHAYKPGFAYAAGVAAFVPMHIAGVLCYQGESNAQEPERVAEYAALNELMINDYRQVWQQPKLPFYFVQLSSIEATNYKSALWPAFRNEQRLMLDKIAFSGMAVSSDVGARHDVHPTDKKTIGQRLALWALRDVYGQRITASGPLPLSARYKKGKVVIRFVHSKGLQTANATPLQGFSLNGASLVPAQLRKNKVIISTHIKPEAVYYGWQPYSNGNLLNAAQLPASTFKIAVQ
ncbi:MAG: sialate O-acetylesterase [Chitinophagaceae bacterium]|nr:sialate O-acetylesterase [Chitinophagaceae bacterium]